MKTSLSILLLFTCLAQQSIGQEEEIKTGWNFGALPTIAFDSDLGFQYGGLINLYHYGDGSRYPKYNHSLYLEISRFTRGSGINRLFYDSDQLLKGIRTTFDLSYVTDPKMDFFGFNGYETVYNPAFTDVEHPEYVSRVFYAFDRKMFRVKADLQGRLSGNSLRWVTGLASYHFQTGVVDKEKYELPDAETLYEKYINWGIIGDDEKDGGWVNYLKAGLSYDTRDNEPNPMKGIWTEAVIQTAPGFLGNGDFGHTKIAITHRQYFTLIKKDLSLAYRIAWQQTLGDGRVPFYAQPLVITSFLKGTTSQGLGGSKTIRGILRHRVVGDGFVYGNVELRWKFVRFRFINQNFYLALNPFWDFGIITDPVNVDFSSFDYGTEFTEEDFFTGEKDRLHNSVGTGLKIAMNQNFIVSVDFGKALDEQDGNTGLYIGLNFLF
ncbi:MAG TPA: hypothetical protein ENN63_04250 [Bacteroidetes bacterium]|nr:hypothetical protein [Bacteroidota bacterium]